MAVEKKGIIIESSSQPILRPDQNIVDQRPFTDILSLFPQGYFKEGEELSGLATFIDIIWKIPAGRCSAEFGVGSKFRKLRRYISEELRSRVATIGEDAKNIIETTSYFKQYIDSEWFGTDSHFTSTGDPKSGDTHEVPTFAAYQHQMIEQEKRLRMAGVEKENLGFSTPAILRDRYRNSGKR